MAVSVAAVMRQCRNYFETGYIDGTFRITGDVLPEAEGYRWVYISNSINYSGVWEVRDGRLINTPQDVFDEEFDGRVWLLNPPHDFLELCETIRAYEEKNPVGALEQEKFGEYSYMRGQAGTARDSSWQVAFSAALTPYRKMFTEVR